MWGCMRLEGAEKCVRITGRMDANQYGDILQQDLCGSLEVCDMSHSWAPYSSKIMTFRAVLPTV